MWILSLNAGFRLACRFAATAYCSRVTTLSFQTTLILSLSGIILKLNRIQLLAINKGLTFVSVCENQVSLKPMHLQYNSIREVDSQIWMLRDLLQKQILWFSSAAVDKAAGLSINWQDVCYPLIFPRRPVALGQLYITIKSSNAASGKLVWKQTTHKVNAPGVNG